MVVLPSYSRLQESAPCLTPHDSGSLTHYIEHQRNPGMELSANQEWILVQHPGVAVVTGNRCLSFSRCFGESLLASFASACIETFSAARLSISALVPGRASLSLNKSRAWPQEEIALEAWWREGEHYMGLDTAH